ncbi:hypothetical protein EJ05DRAFT_498023 [Pseudovirgaria hyperparasitica]|uniref:Apple domain-containing protein n=1 Tax=Pseudovirgaria hyperparasitica TaxID=470096 RepID=A0A6A6WF73_9PEZI|nr:uncharacterized protein EJ05DRAFT_498023 [Pseudovirgaria hyperparasitica]KAF2761472.1 hypothetical protein EJ05DRAFT_498023 [Pseudovirgaria hyperparasitica]
MVQNDPTPSYGSETRNGMDMYSSNSGMEVIKPHSDMDVYNPPQPWPSAKASVRHEKYIKLRRSTLTMSAIFMVIIICAVVGGAIGGTQALKHAREECHSSHQFVQPTSPPVSTVTYTSAGQVFTTVVQQTTTSYQVDFHGSRTISLEQGSTSWGPMPTYISIPPAENSTYTSPASGMKFDTVYGKQYNGDDIIPVLANSFEACIEACVNRQMMIKAQNAQGPECAGVGWIPVDAARGNYDNTVAGNCYVKSSLGTGPLEDQPRGAQYYIAIRRSDL